MKREKAEAFISAVVALREELTDEQAAKHPALFPEYKEGKEYKENERVNHGGALFKATKEHKPAKGSKPTGKSAHFEKLGK